MLNNLSLLATAVVLVLQLCSTAMAGDKWFVFSDLETDDAMMMYILSQNPAIVPSAMIVGAGNDVSMKVARARVWLSIFYPEKHSSIEVIAGDLDDKKFEDEGLAEGLSEGADPSTFRNAVDRLPELLQESKDNEDDVHIISAKPMSELFRVWKSNPSAFENAEAFSYLSFNVRGLYTHESEADIVEFINTAFGNGHTVFESHEIMGANSCGALNALPFFNTFQDSISNGNKRLELVQKIMTDWNASLNRRMKSELVVLIEKFGLPTEVVNKMKDDAIAGVLDRAKLQSYLTGEGDKGLISRVLRKAKVVGSINRHQGTQFVVADQLIALHLGGYLDATTKTVKYEVDKETKFSVFGKRCGCNKSSTLMIPVLNGDDIKEVDQPESTKALSTVIEAMQLCIVKERYGNVRFARED